MRVISGTARGTKLFSLEGENTRPTLDRVKESLFNILNSKIYNSSILDLFAGSGALSIEALSRGAFFSVLCDNSKDAVKIIKRNLEKTNFSDKTKIIVSDFKSALNKLINEKMKFDIIFLDPPYKSDFVYESLEIISNSDLINDDGIIVVETDDPDRIIENIEKIKIDIYDNRKYGRVSLIFLNRKG